MSFKPICEAVAAASCESNAAAATQYEHFHLIAAKKPVAGAAPCERTLTCCFFFKLNLKLCTSFRSEQYLQLLNTMRTYRPSRKKDKEWEYWWAVQDLPIRATLTS